MDEKIIPINSASLNLSTSLKLIWNDTKKYPCITIIAMLSIAFVMGVTGIFQTLI